jgi:hypothetical protein
MNDFSKSFAELAAALASLCLALLALSVPSPGAVIVIPWIVRIILSGAGTALLVAAALLVDWTVDSFSEEDWQKLDSVVLRLREPALNRRYNYFLARCRLFGGGYLLLSVGFSAITFVMMWVVGIHVDNANKVLHAASTVVASISAVALFLKMMTFHLATTAWWLILISGLAAASITLNVVLLSR